MQKLKILDLFSGLGGFSLGLERTGRYKTVAFCEIDKYCTLLLQKHWKGVKIYNDVKKITKEGFEADGIESPDIITGGFPCQPFSVAGKQKGTSDDRHLWPEMFRIIKAFKPRFVIGENVPGIVNIQDGVVFETVCTDLESQGYEVQPFNIPAAAVGAPHQRKRIWIIATLADSVSNDERREISRSDEEKGRVQEEHRSKDSASGIFSGTSEIRKGNNGYEAMENSGRTLQQGSSIREKNEDEVGKENANQHQRSSSSSESNVADTDTRLSDGQKKELQSRGQASISSREGENVANAISRNVEAGRERQRGVRTESEGQRTSNHVASSGETSRKGEDVANAKSISSDGREIGQHSEESREKRKIGIEVGGVSSDRQKLANTDSERLEGLGQSRSQFNETSSSTSSSEERQGQVGQGWWEFEPNVGRVAHGVPGRVHRLKALGNSIVPQIAEEIGRAIIKAADDA